MTTASQNQMPASVGRTVRMFLRQFEKTFRDILQPIPGNGGLNLERPGFYYKNIAVGVPRYPFSDWDIWCYLNPNQSTVDNLIKIEKFFRAFTLLECSGLILASDTTMPLHWHCLSMKNWEHFMGFIKEPEEHRFFDFSVRNVNPESLRPIYRSDKEYISWIMLTALRSKKNFEWCQQNNVKCDDWRGIFSLIQPSLTKEECEEWSVLGTETFFENYIKKNLCSTAIDYLTKKI